MRTGLLEVILRAEAPTVAQVSAVCVMVGWCLCVCVCVCVCVCQQDSVRGERVHSSSPSTTSCATHVSDTTGAPLLVTQQITDMHSSVLVVLGLELF